MNRFSRMRSLLILALASAIAAAPQNAQAQAAATAPARIPADPKDVESIDAIMSAVYASISGPAGAQRQWDRFRSLMAPNARLVPTGQNAQGRGWLRNWSVEEYITAADSGLKTNGFFERELGRKMERYGNVVHLMSSYDSKRSESDPQPFQRGVNSFQLWYDGTRWYVVSIFWQAESPATPIPADLLRGVRP